MQRRHFTGAFACAFTSAPLATLSRGAWAQSRAAAAPDFPKRAVTLLLPFPAATTPDIVTRILAEGLTAELGQPVVVDNRGGAGGIIGTTLVAKAQADGYTLLMGSISTHAVNKTLYKSLPYDPVKDFDPVVLLTQAPNTVLVNKDLPVQTLPEFIAYAKARPGKLSFGSSGNGTAQHLAGEMFKSQAGIDLLHVPYKGGAASLTALRAGEVQAMFEVLPSALPHIQGDAVRALAVTSAERVALLPQLPTVKESALPDYVVTTWHGFFVPAGTPGAVIDALNASIRRVMAMPQYRDRIEKLGFVPSTGTPEAFRAFVAAEAARWAVIVKTSGARVD